jgi:putative chitinase
MFPSAPRFSLTLNDIVLVNAKFLCALLPRLSLPRAEQFVVPLNSYLAKYRINTIQRIAAFMGQVAVESSQFCKLVESTYYRDAKHLKETFPGAFNTAHAADYVKHSEKLANFVYANKNGNGDEKSGDGSKYRGRGLMQLTFRNNYAAFAKDAGVDAVNHPELLEEPGIAVYSAAGFGAEHTLILLLIAEASRR